MVDKNMSNNVIETRDLTVYYGNHRGIVDVNLAVKKGEVFGFLGPNGAGKTTTQRVLLDVFPPSAGSASIFGLDCQKQGVEIRKRVGYLPGELALYTNMKAKRFFRMIEYLRGEHTATDYWRELADRLDLDISRNISEFSRGNKQKVGVIAAFMSQSDLLILDEPTSGLDPLVQQTVLEMVREAKDEGRTIFFSSHILSEVQAVCDRVGIIREGRITAIERVEDLVSQRMNRVTLTFDSLPPAEIFAIEGVTELKRDEQHVVLEIMENLAQVLVAAGQHEVLDIETHNISLEEIFLTYYGKGNGDKHG